MIKKVFRCQKDKNTSRTPRLEGNIKTYYTLLYLFLYYSYSYIAYLVMLLLRLFCHNLDPATLTLLKRHRRYWNLAGIFRLETAGY